MKKLLVTCLSALMISSAIISPVSAAVISTETSAMTPFNSRVQRAWNQSIPKTNASLNSNEMILFTPTKSTITFRVESLSSIPNVNIGVVGFCYNDYGTIYKGDTITFTGLIPGQPYNAKFSCSSGSGTARLLMDY